MITPSRGGRRTIRVWVFDPEALTLTHRKEGYEVDLEELNSSAEMLDWIVQIAKKTWVDASTLAEFVWALDEIFDIQANVCSFGKNRGPIPVRNTVEKVRQKRGRS